MIPIILRSSFWWGLEGLLERKKQESLFLERNSALASLDLSDLSEKQPEIGIVSARND